MLSVGDAATDVFIRLTHPHIRVHELEDGRGLDLPSGGKVPFDYALTIEAAGNAANAAVGFARLGLSASLAAQVGTDQIGGTCRRPCTARASTHIWCASTPGDQATETSCCGTARTGPSWCGTRSTTTTGRS